MFDVLWLRMLVQSRDEPIPRARQREFERELENHVGFGGLKAIIRCFVPW